MSTIRAAITIETAEDLDEGTAQEFIEHLNGENGRYPYRVYATLRSVNGSVRSIEFSSLEQPAEVAAE